jgi:hypothetical protein
MKDGVVLKSEQGAAVTTIGFTPDAWTVIFAADLPSQDTVIDGFTIMGVYGWGFYVHDSGNVTFRNCIFRDMYDAGIYADGDVSIIDCEFINCGSSYGAGVIHSGGHLEIIGSTFRESTVSGLSVAGSATITGCLFQGNGSLDVPYGGLNAAGKPLVIEECIFLDNSGEWAGGVDAYSYQSVLMMRNNTFVGNSSQYGGAATSL